MASKKKSITQRAVGLAAPVMPAPVAKVVGTRWGSRLFILMLPFLFATGVLTVSWSNGIPTVNFDRARALFVGQQVGQTVGQEALRVAQDVRQREAATVPQQQWGQAQPTAWQGQPAYPQPPQQSAFQQPHYPQPSFQQPAMQPSPSPQWPREPQQATQPWAPAAYR